MNKVLLFILLAFLYSSMPIFAIEQNQSDVKTYNNKGAVVKIDSRNNKNFRSPEMIGRFTNGAIGNGDETTEACVMKVLWWLKATQNADGSWSNSRAGGTLANTAFAVLTYLAHGEFPNSSSVYETDFGPVVQRAVNYLINSVEDTNYAVRMKGSDGNEYAFLIATYALCEAYGMTKDPAIKDVAVKCLRRIVENQSATGGWDYRLNKNSNRDDVSFAGWAMQALKSVRMAGLKIDGLDACIKKAMNCLVKRNYNNGTFYYTAMQRNVNHPGLAAVGCYALQSFGYNGKEVTQSLEYMRDWKPTFERGAITHKGKRESTNYCPQYYCYYATQSKFIAGKNDYANWKNIQSWNNWNKQMKNLFVSKIINLDATVKDSSGREHRQGYYRNDDSFSSRPYMDSCLAALQLMVYYRYYPNWRQNQEYGSTIDSSKILAKQLQEQARVRKLKEEREAEEQRQKAVADFDLKSFMGFEFGANLLQSTANGKSGELSIRFSNIKHGGKLRNTHDGVIYVGELVRYFRKFKAVVLTGTKSGCVYKIVLLCPDNSFTTKESRTDELRSLVKMMEKKYSVISFTISDNEAFFRNENIEISISLDDYSGGGVICVENKKIKAKMIEEEASNIRRKEKVGENVGADML